MEKVSVVVVKAGLSGGGSGYNRERSGQGFAGGGAGRPRTDGGSGAPRDRSGEGFGENRPPREKFEFRSRVEWWRFRTKVARRQVIRIRAATIPQTAQKERLFPVKVIPKKKIARRTRSFNDASTSTFRADAKLRNRPSRPPRAGKPTTPAAAIPSSDSPEGYVPIEYPVAFEANPSDSMFLQSYKGLLRKHLSLRKPQTLHEEVLLSVFLCAVDRAGQALQIVTFLGHNFEYIGDLEQWKPVAMGICIQARLLRLAKRAELAAKAMQKLAEHPFLSKTNRRLATRSVVLPRDSASYEKVYKSGLPGNR